MLTNVDAEQQGGLFLTLFFFAHNLNKKDMTSERKTTVQFILAFVIAFIGIALIFCSFFVPPMGVIHASVLAAFGEILTFSGAILGIDYTYRKHLLKHKKDENAGN